MKSRELILLFLFFSLSVSAQTLDEIINKHLEATGHQNLLKKNSLTAKGKIVQGQNQFPFISYSKRPDKFRMDGTIQGYTFTQAYDGETGWVVNPLMGIKEPMKLPPSETENLKFQSDFDGLIYNHREKNYTLEYIGNDEASGTAAFVILLTKASGDSMYIYLDTENYLTLETRSKASVGGESRYLDNIYSDYREVDGILSAFDVKTQVEGITLSQLIYDSYDYSAEVPDSVFTFKVNEPTETTEPDSGSVQ